VRFRPVAVTALVAAGVVLAGCGSGSSGKSDSSKSKSTPSAAASSSLSSVTIKSGKTPTLSLAKKPFSVQKTSVKVVTPGHGATVKKGQSVSVDYVLVDGRDGKQADTTFGKQPQSFPADEAQVLPGIVKGMVNQRVGSRVLVGISPADGFKSQGGNQDLGIQANDSLVMLLDIKGAHTPLDHAEGTVVPPKAGLPTVKVDAKDHATIAIPKTAAPKKLIVQPLIEGKGKTVQSGQTVSAKYTGVIWSTGKEFDSTASHPGGAAAPFPVGVGQVIPAWDKGLVGQKVGSRLLIIAPPADGYGTQGNSQAGIKGTDTLVFVVDIVDVN
jgi:peptidylprolyl isomerase